MPKQGEGAPANANAAEVIRLKTVQVLSERIRLLGVARSGAYEHYQLQLSSGFPIPPGEIAILDLIKHRFPNLRSYHEIGSGLGTLPLMLAHAGFTSVGIERDERRHLTAMAILHELVAELPHIETNCRLIGASFPDAVADLDVSESMAILTDFVASQAPRDYIRMCKGLAQYRYVLMDVQRFCVKRDSEDEQERLVEELVSHGLSPCGDVIDLASQGYYRLFESRRAFGSPEPTSDPDAATDSTATPVLSSSPAQRQSVKLATPGGPGQVQSQAAAALVAPEEAAVATPVRRLSLPPMPSRARRKRFGGWLALSALLVIGFPSILGIAYYGFVASSQYVTSFQFAVRGPSQAAAAHAGGGSSMLGSSAMTPDSFVVADYINSAQAVADVEGRLDLRALFSRPNIDFWSRLSPEATMEELSVYWTHVVLARYDIISGNIVVTVHAFTPDDSAKLAQAIVAVSDEMFRKINSQAQQDYVQVADQNVDRSQQQLVAASRALAQFRNTSGLVDPKLTAQAGATIVDDMRKQLATLQGQYASIKSTTPNSPILASLASQIAAMEGQIRKEEPLASSLVRSVSAESLDKYQALDLEWQTAQRLLQEAIILRNQAYVFAQSQQSYLALFVAPRRPQSSTYPNRPRSIAAVVLSAALAWFVGMLIVYTIRDHLM